MKKAYYLIIAVVFFGCSKNSDLILPKTINSQSVQQATAVATYLPLTKGTYWDYSVAASGKPLATSKLTVLGLPKTVNAKTYQTVQSVDGGYKSTVYYAQSGHNYYVYTNSTGSSKDKVNLEILFLKDNVATGASWSASAGSANGFDLKSYGKVVKTGLALTVGGKTYKDVIQTHVDLKATFWFFSITVYTQDYYVAKNVGIIKNVSTQKYPSTSTITTNLTGYSIK